MKSDYLKWAIFLILIFSSTSHAGLLWNADDNASKEARRVDRLLDLANLSMTAKEISLWSESDPTDSLRFVKSMNPEETAKQFAHDVKAMGKSLRDFNLSPSELDTKVKFANAAWACAFKSWSEREAELGIPAGDLDFNRSRFESSRVKAGEAHRCLMNGDDWNKLYKKARLQTGVDLLCKDAKIIQNAESEVRGESTLETVLNRYVVHLKKLLNRKKQPVIPEECKVTANKLVEISARNAAEILRKIQTDTMWRIIIEETQLEHAKLNIASMKREVIKLDGYISDIERAAAEAKATAIRP